MCSKDDNNGPKSGKFTMNNVKHYHNSLCRWWKTYREISIETQEKQKEFENMYNILEAEFSKKEKSHFDIILLQSYYESILKMQKNKAKYICLTYMWIFMDAVLSLITGFTMIISVIGGVQPFMSLAKVIVSKIPVLKNEKIIEVLGLILGAVFIFSIFIIMMYIFHKIISIIMKEFKPKETWIRHNRQCYLMSLEIMDYLDRQGEYKGLDNDLAYKYLQIRVKKLWHSNFNKFWKAMEKEE